MLAGNPGHQKLNKNEPKIENKIPDAPDYLGPVGKAQWDIVTQQLFDAGMMTSMDGHIVAQYCDAFELFSDAVKNLKKHGPIVKAPKTGTPMQSPYLSVVNKAKDQMHKYLVELGMTPSARSRIIVNDKAQENEFASFLMRKGNNG